MDKKEEIKTAVESLKAAYMELAKNKTVMEDLRTFCALSVQEHFVHYLCLLKCTEKHQTLM